MTIVKSKFYTYDQNNSGGSFTVDEKAGICIIVVIEAADADHANARAEDIGLYFDGCDKGMDCDCCGDRWYKVDNRDAKIVPSLYDTPIDEYTKEFFYKRAFIHYLNGTIEKVDFKEPSN